MNRRQQAWVGVAAALAASPAAAQRSTDNAVTAAEDAFGTSVGNETIGLYSPYEVRGFSAIDAGNARIAGLYFDQQIDPVNHLIAESTIRVGISAQGYPLPAPTGIVDYALRRAGKRAVYSGIVTLGPFGTRDAQADLQLPLVTDRLSLVAGGTISREDVGIGTTSGYANVAVMPRWTPSERVEVIAFASGSWAWNAEAEPLLFVAGPYLPPRIERGRFYGQNWADNRNAGMNAGALATVALGRTAIRAGVFRSRFSVQRSYANLFLDVLPDGTADNLLIANRSQRYASTSGELRVSHRFGSEERGHVLHLVARGRDQRRRFGGDAVLDLGRARIGVPRPMEELDFTPGPTTRDRVRQFTLAAAYEGKPLRWLELSAGVQKANYRKTTLLPSVSEAADAIVGRDRPFLYNVAAAVTPTKRLALYGSFTQGLEEGGIAPANAVNKDAASPALRTRQLDAGIRYALTDKLKAVAGVFDVRKPYFNLDPAQVYRRLGDYRQRGIELSLAGAPVDGLYVVTGGLLLDPRVTGEEVAVGLIGSRPVGQTRRLIIASADYQLPMLSGVSVNTTITSVGDRVASRDNRLVVPARTTFDIGARYRFDVGKAPATLSVHVSNLFDKFGWRTNASEVFVPLTQRRITASLAADF